MEKDGLPVAAYDNVVPGDELILHFPEVTSWPYEPEKGGLPIIYEDEDVMVIDKPSGIAMTPSSIHPEHTVVQLVAGHYESMGWHQRVHPLTRLDRDTSGLLAIAKHPYSHSLFQRQSENITRTYLALVEGSPDEKKGTVQAPIARKETSIIERHVSREGKRAVTHYEVIEEDGEKSLLRLSLETGRTHQIRVHMAFLGHPLHGDELYGGGVSEEFKGQALHSSELTFTHPFRKVRMSFSSVPPFS